MQHGDAIGRGTLAQTRDYGMQQTGKTGQEQRPCEGESHALVLKIAFPDGLGMDNEKPRKHGQDPVGHRE